MLVICIQFHFPATGHQPGAASENPGWIIGSLPLLPEADGGKMLNVRLHENPKTCTLEQLWDAEAASATANFEL